jgi:GR25 family glycosyltransferase involved in LPS biosynthesis
MKHIDHTYYINLDKREDRNRHTLKTVIPFLGLNDKDFSRVSAVDTSSAQSVSLRSVGCAQSHINIYKDAINKDYKYILILEDDFVPIIKQETFFDNLDFLFDNFDNFNVCQIAYNDVSKGVPLNNPDSPILFSPNVQTTSGYIIKVSFLSEIIPTIESSISCLKNNESSMTHAIDQCWKKFQTMENNWYLMDRVGIQADNYSDIEGRETSYNC